MSLLMHFICANLWAQISTPPLDFGDAFFSKNLDQKRVWVQDKVFSSVKVEKTLKPKANLLKLKSLGVINTPLSFCFNELKNFKAYEGYSQFVDKVDVIKDKQILIIKFSAFKYSATLKIKYFYQMQSPTKAIIFGKVIDGTFKGLKFQLETVDAYALDKGRRKSRVLLKALHAYVKLPLPEFFLKFGFEVVLEKLSKTLKYEIEKKYSQALKARKK
jgi:hypothetical protein